MIEVKTERGETTITAIGMTSELLADFTMVFKSFVDALVNNGNPRHIIVGLLAESMARAEGFNGGFNGSD